MSTFSNQSKNSATFSNQSKSLSETIYLVSEALDFYLIGTASDEVLVTQDVIQWSNQTKN